MQHRPQPFGLTEILAVAFVGCSQPISHISQPIINGEANNDNSVMFVLGVAPDSSAHASTGVLIAPDLVLTCRHCVQDNPGGVVASCTEPFADRTTWGLEIYQGSGVSQAMLNQAGTIGTAIFPPGDQNACDGDVALIRLARPLDVTPVALRDTRPVVGEAAYVVGYGLTTPRQDHPDPRLRLEGEGVVEELSGNRAPPTFQMNVRGCEGDSGAPVFGQDGRVMGVFTRTANLDCQRTFGIALSPFRRWLNEEIAASYQRHSDREPPAPRTSAVANSDGGADVGTDGGLQRIEQATGCAIHPTSLSSVWSGWWVLLCVALSRHNRRRKISWSPYLGHVG